MGFLGERILVNGQVTPLLPVATRAYRLRLLNGSNSRVYKLAWSTGAPLTVIASDGGLLEQPVLRPYVMLGPGERVELWADFSQFPLGSEITLQSLAFLGAEGDSLLAGGADMPAPTDAMGAMPGMGHDMGTSATPAPTPMPGMGETPALTAGSHSAAGMADYNPALPNGAAFDIMRVRVERQEAETLSLPARLSTIDRYRIDQAANGRQPRRFGLSMRNSTWLINGRSFRLEEVAEDEVVKLGSLEAWEFVNELNPDEPMEKMGMVHPMHIHGVQFQVMERQVLVPELQAGWDSVREGFVDEGWKDTVLIMPGERVRLLTRFEFPDLFLFHCHNLEHEDLGMMRNYRAEA
jgi:FtsP/CotA-like multicopper oxidase with cupredoxin domain